jgi:hypothetical protein
MRNLKNIDQNTKNVWGQTVEPTRKSAGQAVHDYASCTQIIFALHRLRTTRLFVRKHVVVIPRRFTHPFQSIQRVVGGLCTLSPGLIIVITKETI